MDENINTTETGAVEELANVAKAGLAFGPKVALIVLGVTAVSGAIYGFVVRPKLKAIKAQKEAEDIAFKNAKVVAGDFIPESETK